MSRCSLLVVLALALMVSFNAVLVSAQCTGTYQTCQNVEATLGDQSLVVSLTLSFEDLDSTTTGPICSLGTTSGISNTAISPAIIGTPITLVDCASTTPFPNKVTSTVTAFGSYISSITVCFTSSLDNNAATGILTGSITQPIPGVNVFVPNLSITYKPLTGTTSAVYLPQVKQDFCTAEMNADPHFKGFYGQSFFVGGEVGGVMNLLSTSLLQLNARVVFLAEGESMNAAEMARARRFAEIFHAKSRSAPLLPYTRGWEEEGNYMGELGIAMVGGHRLYAQPGSYQAGWNTVTLDGVDILPQSSHVVGDIEINRTSSHKIEVHTPLVDFTLVNSDNFFNIENAHLEDGWKAPKGYAGVLGQTADATFQAHVGDKEWQQKVEDQAMVPNNDLFAFSAHTTKQ